MPIEGLQEFSPDKPIRLDNVTCPYCGRDVSREWTDDHVVSRRSVPRGTLDRQWNLIVRTCVVCNDRKARLEDDISAITMQPDVFGRYADDDPRLAVDAGRKGKKSRSRRTKTVVAKSSETFAVRAELAPGVALKAEFMAPPQIDRQRLAELARFHARAFFYFVTYNPETRSGRWWPGGPFSFVEAAAKRDWGNTTMRAFMNLVEGWEPRFIATTARGFYVVTIRRHPTVPCWSWAMEWNMNMRAIGFFGDEETIKAIVGGFPPVQVMSLAEGANGDYVRMRYDTPLEDADDKLFSWKGLNLKS